MVIGRRRGHLATGRPRLRMCCTGSALLSGRHDDAVQASHGTSRALHGSMAAGPEHLATNSL